MENLFKTGEIVYSRNPPRVKMIVRRNVDKVYYCKVFNHPGNREMSFAERDLMASINPMEKRRP